MESPSCFGNSPRSRSWAFSPIFSNSTSTACACSSRAFDSTRIMISSAVELLEFPRDRPIFLVQRLHLLLLFRSQLPSVRRLSVRIELRFVLAHLLLVL